MQASVFASPSYNSILKKWTRHESVYVWDNLEARVIWNVTYLSEEYREASRKKLGRLYEWSTREHQLHVAEDQKDLGEYDVFFVGVYAGSSQYSEIGKDTGRWRIVLDTGNGLEVEPAQFSRVTITEVERALYPYLDRWSQAYLLKFPKSVEAGKSFRLRMTGIPARSELIWKVK